MRASLRLSGDRGAGSDVAILGVDVGGSKMLGVLSDGAGVVHEEVVLRHSENGPVDPFQRLICLIQGLIQAAGVGPESICGIGVGAPGLTRVPAGVVAWAPSLQWREFPLQQRLRGRLQVPVFVENDVNLAALGEWGFGAGRSVDSLIALAIGTGIGAGIVIDGRLCRGHRYAAGEVGYMLPGPEYLGRRYDGFGALESLAAAPGIAARGRHLAPAGALEGDADAEAVFTAARAGCRWALRVVAETVDYLSLAIGNIQALLDPELIVLAGGVARSADLLIPAVLERLEGALAAPPNLVAAELGSHAIAMGGVATVLQRMQ